MVKQTWMPQNHEGAIMTQGNPQLKVLTSKKPDIFQ